MIAHAANSGRPLAGLSCGRVPGDAQDLRGAAGQHEGATQGKPEELGVLIFGVLATCVPGTAGHCHVVQLQAWSHHPCMMRDFVSPAS